MPITAPRTWIAGELVTAALLNAQIRDQMAVLQSPGNVSTVFRGDGTYGGITPQTISGFPAQLTYALRGDGSWGPAYTTPQNISGYPNDAGVQLRGDGSWGPPQVVAVYSAGPHGNGVTYTITAPSAGTYILEWGGGKMNSQSQGATVTITNNKTGGVAAFGDVGGSGGPVVRPGTGCAAGEVITFTIAVAGATIEHVWAKLTRTA